MMKFKQLVVVSVLVFCTNVLCAQQYAVKANLDSVSLLIGEQATLTFTRSQPTNSIVRSPIFSDTIVSGLEIVEHLKNDTTVLPNDLLQIDEHYVVTGFDSALVYIPSFPFVSDQDTFFSNPLSLKIISIPVDTTQQSIADIKPIYQPPFDWGLFFKIAFICLLVVALIVVGILLYRRFFKKRSPENVVSEPVDTRLAHEIAFEKLEEVRLAHLWQEGRVKEYYTQLSDILKLYLNKRFHLSTAEHTSDEILTEIRDNKILEAPENFRQIQYVFQLSDLVKFAKWNPLPEENDNSFKKVYDFVDQTKEVQVETNDSSNTASTDSASTL